MKDLGIGLGALVYLFEMLNRALLTKDETKLIPIRNVYHQAAPVLTKSRRVGEERRPGKKLGGHLDTGPQTSRRAV